MITHERAAGGPASPPNAQHSMQREPAYTAADGLAPSPAYGWPAGTCRVCKTPLQVALRPDRALAWRCAGCGREGLDLESPESVEIGAASRIPRGRIMVDDRLDATRRAAVERLWARTRPIREGSPVGIYLAGRDLPVPPPEGDVRELARHGLWLPPKTGDRWQWHDGPCMVAGITDPVTSELVGLQLTGITASGRTSRRTYKAARGRAGVVRVWPDEVVQAMGKLVLGEGVESAIAGSLLGLPSWAALGTSGLRSLAPVPGVREAVILAEADDAGRAAAQACGRSWAEAGIATQVWDPPADSPPHYDFNDLVKVALADPRVPA